MAKNYDPRPIKSYRSYKVRDVCRLYKAKKLHPQTVRGWVNDGLLEGFLHGKTLYIYGAVLKKFFTERNDQRKNPLEFNQFKCWKCKAIDTPLNNTITTLEEGMNGCVRATCVCSACGRETSRNYKREAEVQILECFTVQHNKLGGLCDSVCSDRKTNIKEVRKTASCESEKNRGASAKQQDVVCNDIAVDSSEENSLISPTKMQKIEHEVKIKKQCLQHPKKSTSAYREANIEAIQLSLF